MNFVTLSRELCLNCSADLAGKDYNCVTFTSQYVQYPSETRPIV